MRELITVRDARPEVPPATDEAREAARARLISLIDSDLDGLPDGRFVVTDRTTHVTRPSRGEAPLLPPTGQGDEAGSIVRSRPRRWIVAVAAAAVALGFVLIDGLSRSPVDTPVIEEPSGPLVPDRAAFGTFVTVSTDATLWEGPGGHATITTPAENGPWPIVVLLFPGDVVNEERSTFPSRHVEAMQPIAELIASAGAVVINTGWAEVRDPATVAELDAALTNIHCAVAYARTAGATHGGDPSRVALFGQGGSAFAAIDSVLSGAPLRDGCRATAPAHPDVVVSVGGDLELDELTFGAHLFADLPGGIDSRQLGARARAGQDVPLVLIDAPPGEVGMGSNDVDAPTEVEYGQDAVRVANALSSLGYDVSVVPVAGLGGSAWAPSHGATRTAMDLLVDEAHRER